MSVPTETSEVAYTGNGVTTVFTTGFYFLDSSELVVKQTPAGTGIEVTLVLGVHYSVTMPTVVGGNGSITMVTAPDVSDALTIEREVPLTQVTSFRTQGSFSPAVHEDALDEGVFIDQQLDRRIRRLEALADLVSQATFDAQIQVLNFIADETDVEDTAWSGTVNVPSNLTVTGISVIRVEYPSSPGDDSWEAVTVRHYSCLADGPDTATLTIDRFTGLTPGVSYTLTCLLFTIPVD